MNSFSIGEIIRESFGIFKKNWQGLYIIFIVLFLLNFIPSILASVFQENAPIVSVLVQIVSWIISMVVAIGFIRVLLNIVDEGKAEVPDLFYVVKQPKLILKYLGTSIVMAFIFVGLALPFVAVGFIGSAILGTNGGSIIWVILMIPIVIGLMFVSIRLQFWLYIFVDKNIWGFETLKKSWDLTKGLVLNILLFVLVLLGINLVGLLCLIVGLFVTVPLTTLAMAVLYRKLQSR